MLTFLGHLFFFFVKFIALLYFYCFLAKGESNVTLEFNLYIIEEDVMFILNYKYIFRKFHKNIFNATEGYFHF